MTSREQDRLDARRAAYSSIGSALAHLDDAGLRAIVPRPSGDQTTWGLSTPGVVGEMPVFVKRVPLTEVEQARTFSTRNHFRIPTFYNYGVGSAGFGAWRELVAHITTTNWVLEGACVHFPLLLHWRVLERKGKALQPAGFRDPATAAQYVKRWNNSKAIANYMNARGAAPYELWLVLEHVPHVLSTWLPENAERVTDVIEQVLATLDFLRGHGVVHFDAHLSNIVTDGETCYLTDFGLVNDTRFDLTDTERAFVARHTYYDYALFLMQFNGGVARGFRDMTPDQRRETEALCGFTENMTWAATLDKLTENLDVLVEQKLMRIAPGMATAAQRYREVIFYMADFLGDLMANPRKDNTFDDAGVRASLRRAGLPL